MGRKKLLIFLLLFCLVLGIVFCLNACFSNKQAGKEIPTQVGTDKTVQIGKKEPVQNIVGASWVGGESTELTRLGHGVGKSPGVDFDNVYPWSEMKLCNVADDGTITAYLGEAEFKRDGSNGQVMVKIPQFYYKHTYDGQKHEFWVASKETAGFKLHPCFIRKGQEIPYILMGAYQAGEEVVEGTTKLTSVSDTWAVGERGRATFRKQAQNRGAGWQITDVFARNALAFLYLVEYADTDSQKVIGEGVVTTIITVASGGCDYLNGASGVAKGVNGEVSVSYRGLENLWGNHSEFIDGINVSLSDKQPYIADNDFVDDKFDGHYKPTGFMLPFNDEANVSNYQKNFVYSEEDDWLLLPSAVGGSGSTYIPDTIYFYDYGRKSAGGVVRAGGSVYSKDSAGMFDWVVELTTRASTRFYTARLMRIPTGSIQGTVTAKGGGFLAGVNVLVKSEDKTVGSAITGEDGTYTVNNIPPGSYRVLFLTDKDKSLVGMATDVQVKGSQMTENVDQVAIVQITDFVCTNKTEQTVQLNWSKAVGAKGLQILQSADGGATWVEAKTKRIKPTSTTATVTELRGAMTYKFKLVVTEGNHAGDSNIVEVTTTIPQGVSAVGVSWSPVDKTTKMIRLGTGVGKSPGTDFDSLYPWSEMKLCNVADDGTITAYLGEADFMRDGSNGQVMVKIPKFYYKRTSGGKKHEFWVADQEIDGFKLHPSFMRNGVEKDYVLMGAYQAGEINDGGKIKLTSVSGALPAVSRNRATFREQAQERGESWYIVDILSRNAIALLYLVEYADTNCQTGIGPGVVNASSAVASGGCDYLNGASGMAQGTNGEVSVSYRGLEDLWGNVWEFIDGINIKNDERQPYIADHGFADDKFTGNYKASGVILPLGHGYVKDFAWSANTDWLLLPSAVGGSASTYIPDYFSQNWANTADKVAVTSGYWFNSNSSGLFHWNVTNTATDVWTGVGARILQIPK